MSDLDDDDLAAVLSDDGAYEEIELTLTVLGAAFKRPDLMSMLLASGYGDGDIGHRAHRLMWKQAVAQHERGGLVDWKLIETGLVRDGVDPDNARQYVASAISLAEIEAPQLSTYVETIKRRVGLRRTTAIAHKILRDVVKEGATPSAVIAPALRDLEGVQRGAAVMRTVTGVEMAAAGLERLDAPEGSPVRYIRCGIPAIDNDCGGVPRRGMTVIAAQAKRGKTTLAKRLAIHFTRRRLSVTHVSLEAPKNEYAEGLGEIVAGIKLPQDDLRQLSDEARSRFRHAMHSPEVMAVRFEKLTYPTAEELSSLIFAHVRSHAPDVVLVDYIQKIETSTRFQNEERNHAHIARVMEACADNCPNTALIFFSQMKSDERDDRGKRRDHEDPVPQTQEWKRLAYLICDMTRNAQADDEAIRNLTKFRVRHNRPTGRMPVCYFRYDSDTARLHDVDERGEMLLDEGLGNA